MNILRCKPVRTSQLLAEAGITDRHLGDDAIWALVERGLIVIGPDSTLRVVVR